MLLKLPLDLLIYLCSSYLHPRSVLKFALLSSNSYSLRIHQNDIIWLKLCRVRERLLQIQIIYNENYRPDTAERERTKRKELNYYAKPFSGRIGYLCDNITHNREMKLYYQTLIMSKTENELEGHNGNNKNYKIHQQNNKNFNKGTIAILPKDQNNNNNNNNISNHHQVDLYHRLDDSYEIFDHPLSNQSLPKTQNGNNINHHTNFTHSHSFYLSLFSYSCCLIQSQQESQTIEIKITNHEDAPDDFNPVISSRAKDLGLDSIINTQEYETMINRINNCIYEYTMSRTCWKVCWLSCCCIFGIGCIYFGFTVYNCRKKVDALIQVLNKEFEARKTVCALRLSEGEVVESSTLYITFKPNPPALPQFKD